MPMNVYPPHLREAAKRLLANEDMKTLLGYHLQTLQTDAMDSEEPNEVLRLHNEYKALRNFAEAIEIMAGDDL